MGVVTFDRLHDGSGAETLEMRRDRNREADDKEGAKMQRPNPITCVR